MIKLTPPVFEQFIRREHDAYLIGMADANSQPQCLNSIKDLGTARALAKSLNDIDNREYPRFIGVSRDSCYFDPDAPAPAWIPVRYPVGEYRGPFPLAVIY